MRPYTGDLRLAIMYVRFVRFHREAPDVGCRCLGQGKVIMAEPTSAHGKICYIEMPATDVDTSAEFYRTVFGWNIRTDAAGTKAFDDTTGEVSGLWDTNRTAVDNPGMIVSIMVSDAVTTAEAIVAAGGMMVTPVDPAQDEVIATFRDPAGNLLCMYENKDMA